ncbi:heavy metal translocating P-type ATPase [Microbacterium sediminis]|uniref:Cation-transporting P-type ATPase B n=1 Tax=Microbacterium sediminis TaxID=904291 RepID=A0A1B9NCL6_9MICO|nr:heavy metal translocating P-type ATPase [Microbacterium sediminis]OCG74345.1 copper-translocating P-type ATPase [Microbacterium sediminis]QBR73708.1 copper-translocating P-type ATPase [Microbacterium sediminis]
MSAESRGVVLEIEGMTCASCVARVEKRLQAVPGVEAAVNLATESAKVSAPAAVTADALVEAVRSAGYDARVRSDENAAHDAHDHGAHEHGGHVHDVEDAAGATPLRTRLIVSAVLAVPVLAVSMIMPLQFPGWEWAMIALAAPIVLWGGWPFHRATFANARHGATTMDTLITLGTFAALLWSAWAAATGGHVYVEVAAVVTVFLLLGRFIEQRSKRRAGAALRALMELGADEVTRATADGRDGETVPVDALHDGDLFVVRPGERIAADGVIVSGDAAVDESMMTGESAPVHAAAGDAVTGGTIATDGRLVVRATAVGAATRLAHMARLVEDAQARKGAVQRLADRISGVFVPVVIALAALTLVGWLVLGGSVDQALTAAIAVLIIACPCALGLATPVAVLVGTGRGAQLGVLVTGPEAIETAGRLDTVVLDKTGTVTTGRMTLHEVIPAEGTTREELLALAAAAESGSQHPIARAIVAAAPDAPGASRFRTAAGRGVIAEVGGREVFAGSLAFARERGARVPDALVAAAEQAAGSVVVVGWSSFAGMSATARGVLVVADTVRDDSAAAVTGLRALGLDVVLLTGDNERVARDIAAQVGIDTVIAGASPEGKIAEIARLREAGHRVAMVGDGINDSAALAAADLGIAMGGGTDAARHASDITLVRESLGAVGDAVRLSRRMMSIIRGNLFWAFGYNVAAIPLAALGLLNPMIAGAAMAFSSVFVVLNSLRLRAFR